jgi:hypothetical protein
MRKSLGRWTGGAPDLVNLVDLGDLGRLWSFKGLLEREAGAVCGGGAGGSFGCPAATARFALSWVVPHGITPTYLGAAPAALWRAVNTLLSSSHHQGLSHTTLVLQCSIP